jgi:hypothetical protein
MASPERRTSHELDPSLVAAFAGTFLSRTDFYPQQNNCGSYGVVKRPVHVGVVMAHLRGSITIGAYPLSGEHLATWICFDADHDQIWHKLLTMANALERNGIATYREVSRRGGHLWLFTPPMTGQNIRRIGKQLLNEHEITGVELYPRQNRLTTGPGSFVRLPLGIHRKNGRRYSFITGEGTPLAPTIREQVALLSAPQRVPQPFLDAVLARASDEQILFPTPSFTPQEITAGKVSERIKAAISVHQFVSQYVVLDHRGVGLCPFHDDQEVSFQVHEERNFWYCYAECGRPKGGSVIDFWMRMREHDGHDSSFIPTITELAEMLLK